ncbi:class I SAM-dependent methyltransferase [Thiofilum flexile]|uniref:class I SAM-dependent methyltransferase n=1 Tax=Thiofilum flexile TaxID=125627 RepID=UPI0003808192|nr:class I SAM-dependent methyltransferase [Thiofilum flexile]
MSILFEKIESISDFLDWSIANSALLGNSERNTFERYYQSYIKKFHKHTKKHYRSQTIEITNYIKSDTKILEIGSGCGTESLWFALNGADITSIDINPERIEVAKARKKILEDILQKKLKVEFKLCSAFDLDIEGMHHNFDIIWMEQAFHHIEPRTDFLKLLTKIVKKDGLVIFSESNAWNPLIQFSLFLQRGFKTIIYKKTAHGIVAIYGNERIITPLSLKKNLINNDFRVISNRYFRLYPNKGIPETLLKLEDLMPQWAIPFFTHYNFVFQKK